MVTRISGVAPGGLGRKARARSGPRPEAPDTENPSARLRDHEVNPHVDARNLPGNQNIENCLLAIRLQS